MTTAEKITIGVAIAGALGVNALLQVWVTHLLQRRERKINIADRSVQIAEALMTRMEAELTRAQEALGQAQKESEELRQELSNAAAARGEASMRVVELQQRLQEAHVEVAQNAINDARGSANQINEFYRIADEIPPHVVMPRPRFSLPAKPLRPGDEGSGEPDPQS
ncbi:hypothetical protein [Micromonospora musae]|uniref:hypothetical protein n=1 Tax=Micromonospora musae TaxID=1894970 RepID=UPI003406F646